MATITAAQYQELLNYVPRTVGTGDQAQEPADPTSIELSRDYLQALKKNAPLRVKATIDAILARDTYDRIAGLVIEDGYGYINRANMTRADLEAAASGPRLQPPTTTFGRLWGTVTNIPTAATSQARVAFWEEIGYKRSDILRGDVRTSVESTSAATGQLQTSFTNVGSAIDSLAKATNKTADSALQFQQQIETRMDQCEAAVRHLDDSIAAIDTSSEALFAQWNTELAYYADDKQREDSRRLLVSTREVYAQMLDKIRQKRTAIDPTLTKLRDSVLTLRHNINHNALTSWVEDKGRDLAAESAALNQTMIAAMADINAFLKDSGLQPVAAH